MFKKVVLAIVLVGIAVVSVGGCVEDPNNPTDGWDKHSEEWQLCRFDFTLNDKGLSWPQYQGIHCPGAD